MSPRALLCCTLLPSALLLAACEKPPTAAASAAVAAPEKRSRSREASPGRLLITLTGETLGRNSAGDANSTSCQLNPTATNESGVEIKSLHAEFTVRTASDDVALPRAAALTMPIRIAPGESQPAWGPMYIDNHRCEDLALTLNPMQPGACQTVSKAPCPVYALTATGVARAL